MKIKSKMSKIFQLDWEKHPFLYGLFSLGDIGGNNALFDEPHKSDAELLREDWAIIGNDLRKAMHIYGKEAGLC